MSSLYKSKEEQYVINDEAQCFATKSSQDGDRAQVDHRKASVAFYDSTKTETRSEKTKAVRSVEKEPVTPDILTLEEFVQALRKVGFCRKRPM